MIIIKVVGIIMTYSDENDPVGHRLLGDVELRKHSSKGYDSIILLQM